MEKTWMSLNIDLLEANKERLDDDIKSLYPHQAWINIAEVLCMFINTDGNLIIRLSNGTSFIVKKLEEIQAVQGWLEERTFK